MKQESTAADSSEYNEVTGRGLPMIEPAAIDARILASEGFPGCSVPEGPSL